jgi:hypothetical protein
VKAPVLAVLLRRKENCLGGPTISCTPHYFTIANLFGGTQRPEPKLPEAQRIKATAGL